MAAWQAVHGPLAYPGSPAVIRHALRRDDRLIAVEANEHEFGKLDRLFPAGSRAKALRRDGYEAWGAYVPPRERRGLVVVDPPFEAADEFARTLEGKVETEIAVTLDAAVTLAGGDAAASGLANPVVLLSPACASFDQFPNFEVRGQRFKDVVGALP